MGQGAQIIRKRTVGNGWTGVVVLLCLLLSAVAEAGVPVIANQRVTDVATRSFSVIGTVNEPSTVAFSLYSSNCTTPAAGFTSSIQQNTASGTMRLTVTGLSAATTYCYKLSVTSVSTSDQATSPPATVATATAVARTTVAGSNIVPTGNDILAMTGIHLAPDEAREGIIATVELLDSSAVAPLSLILSSDPHRDYFNLNNLIATATGKSLDLAGGERVKITEIHGPGGCVIERYRTIPPDAGGTAARTFTRANPMDIDASGGVDSLDIQRVVGGQGTTTSGSCFNSDLDLNGDGAIDAADLALIEGAVSVTGACGSANGQVFTVAPTANLCSSGTASPVTGTGPWNWTCGGTTASCSAAIQSYSVTAGAGSGGSITPSAPQVVNASATTSFTVTPAAGYQISAVTGCNGTLAGTTYTTGPIIASCTVSATFAHSLAITTTTLSGGSYGTAYSQPLQATGGTAPYSWTVASGTLPPGLTITNGTISGTPTLAGSYSFTLKAGDSTTPAQTATQAFSITIARATLTVTAQNASRAYGTANPAFTATYTGFANNDTQAVVSGTPTVTTTATAASPAGDYDIIVGPGTLAAANYSLQFAKGTLTVAKALLTVTAQNASRAFGAADPAFTASYTGFVNNDTQSVVSGTPVLSTIATAASPAGSYDINVGPGSLSAGNYTFSFVKGTLTVTNGPLAIATTSLGGGSYGTPYSQTLQATGGTAPYAWSVATGTLPPGLTITAGTISGTPTRAGSYGFTLRIGDSSTPAQAATQTFNITIAKATLTVTAHNASRDFGAANPTFTAGYTGLVNNDTLAVVSGAPAFSTIATTASPAGTYDIIVGPGTLAAANYGFSFANGTLTVTGGPLTITTTSLPAGSYGTTYTRQLLADGGVPPYTWSVAAGTLPPGLALVGDSIIGVPTRAVSDNVTLAVSDSSATPGTVTQGYGITIDKALLTVTAVSTTKNAGTANPVLVANYSGFVNNDTPAVLSGSPAITTTAANTSPPGAYDIIVGPGTLAADNYTFTFVNGTLSVTGLATGTDGRTLTPIALTNSSGSQVTIATGTLLKDSAGNPAIGTITITSTAIGSISALPAGAAASETTDGASLISLAASIDLTLSAGGATVKTITPPMTITLPVPAAFATPGTTVQLYSFDGTQWTNEGSSVVKSDGTADIPVGHLSIWAVGTFKRLPSGKIAPGDTSSAVTIADALRALQIAVGIIPPTAADLANGDVAPLVDGRPAPARKGSITVGDAIVILQKALGIVKW